MRADLHMHTTASDGGHTPEQLIAMAHKAKLDVIAITDHDTTEGIAPARAAASRLVVIPGIELSAEETSADGSYRDVHMLGYFIRLEDANLQAQLTQFRSVRADRARRIVEKLSALGLPLAWDRVESIAHGNGSGGGGGGGASDARQGEVAIGRPHIARAMIEAGYADSMPDAFQRYLNADAPAYVARHRLSPEEAITLIHEAGGAAVLAHPGLLHDYAVMVQRLVPAGLDGIELVHPSNNEIVRLNLRALADLHGLVITGGSDFHTADERGHITLGQYAPPENAIPALQARASRYV